MQKESTPYETPDDLVPGEANQLLAQYLTLTEGAVKRYTVDCHNSQLTVARNYMWLSFITLSGYATIFQQCDMGLTLRTYVFLEQGSIFSLLAPLFLIKAAWLSIEVLLNAIQTCTGTSFTEAFENVDAQFTTLENDGFLPNDIYALKRQSLVDLNEILDTALEQADKRGKILRSMATQIRHSIYWAIASIILFALTFL